jgi:hypothetical protein
MAVLAGRCATASAIGLKRSVQSWPRQAPPFNLFLTLARKALKWDEPTDPIKIVGPLTGPKQKQFPKRPWCLTPIS